MRALPWAAALLASALLLAGCSDEPLTAPVTPTSTPALTATPELSPEPSSSPSPSPTPLSAFEADPSVQGLRAYLAAISQALNAKDLQLPALRATATASRAALHEELFTEDLGPFYPGPQPLKILSLRTVTPTQKQILGCFVDDGFGLTKPGGKPAEPLEIVSTQTDMRLEDGTWKVHDAVLAEGVNCTGLTLEDFR